MVSQAGEGSAEDDDNQPLDLSWPDTCRERVTYILFLPIIIPLWVTLPDPRKASGTFQDPALGSVENHQHLKSEKLRRIFFRSANSLPHT